VPPRRGERFQNAGGARGTLGRGDGGSRCPATASTRCWPRRATEDALAAASACTSRDVLLVALLRRRTHSADADREPGERGADSPRLARRYRTRRRTRTGVAAARNHGDSRPDGEPTAPPRPRRRRHHPCGRSPTSSSRPLRGTFADPRVCGPGCRCCVFGTLRGRMGPSIVRYKIAGRSDESVIVRVGRLHPCQCDKSVRGWRRPRAWVERWRSGWWGSAWLPTFFFCGPADRVNCRWASNAHRRCGFGWLGSVRVDRW